MQDNCQNCSPRANTHKGLMYLFFGFVALFGTTSVMVATVGGQTANIVDSLKKTFYPQLVSSVPGSNKLAMREGGLTSAASSTASSTISELSVTRFYPISGNGGKITIYGTGFVSGKTRVYFGGKAKLQAKVLSVEAGSVSVIPPSSGNVNGYITVEVGPSPESMKANSARNSILPTTSVTTEKVPMNISHPADADRTSFPEYVMLGDVNGDGKPTQANDVVLARAFWLNQALPTERQEIAGDVYPKNSNGSFGNGVLNDDDLDVLRAVSQFQTTLDAQVVVRSFYPFVASPGKTVIISGLGFIPTLREASAVEVYFGGNKKVQAPGVNVTNDKLIRVTVPEIEDNNINGYITLRVNGKEYKTTGVAKNIANLPNVYATYPEFVLAGDLDGKGTIGATDLTLLNAIVKGQVNPSERQKLAGDIAPVAVGDGSMPGDGKLDQADVDELRRLYSYHSRATAKTEALGLVTDRMVDSNDDLGKIVITADSIGHIGLKTIAVDFDVNSSYNFPLSADYLRQNSLLIDDARTIEVRPTSVVENSNKKLRVIFQLPDPYFVVTAGAQKNFIVRINSKAAGAEAAGARLKVSLSSVQYLDAINSTGINTQIPSPPLPLTIADIRYSK